MIRRGWAVAYFGDYEGEERAAREDGIGLWAGEFVRPEDWRRSRRSAALVSLLALVGELGGSLADWLAGTPRLRAPPDE